MEENRKRNKTLIISLLAIFGLVSVTIFTSYAFFTYYRAGEKNQRLLTGRIKLEFTDGANNINLTNQFPISDADAMTELPNVQGDVAAANFTVSGYAGGSVTLRYTVSAIKGSVSTGRTRMPDNHIKLYLTATADYGSVDIENGFDYHSGNNYGALASEGRTVDTANDGEILLATGEVGTNNTTHNYTLRMWISDTVTISDTDTTRTYCASSDCNDNRTVYSTLYYSLKIKVENVPIE